MQNNKVIGGGGGSLAGTSDPQRAREDLVYFTSQTCSRHPPQVLWGVKNACKLC